MDELIDSLLDLVKLKRNRDEVYWKCHDDWEIEGEEIEVQLKKAKQRFGEAFKECIFSY